MKPVIKKAFKEEGELEPIEEAKMEETLVAKDQ